MPGPRRLAARARAACLLLQLAPRRVSPMYGSRCAARGRPRPRRARSAALDRRGRARPVVGDELELLRVGDPGDCRPLRDRPRDAMERATGGAARPVPARHGRRACLCPVPEPDGAQALLHALLRRHRQEPRAALPRDGLGPDPRADRGVHELPRVPRLRRRSPQAGGARGHGRRAEHPRVHAAVGDGGARVPRRARADRSRAADRRTHREGDPRAADIPRRCGRRLPRTRPCRVDALGRRGAAATPRDADRLAARGRALHPRRAVDRAPPARQRPADRDARAAPRPRQQRARRRARRADDALGRLARRHGAGGG